MEKTCPSCDAEIFPGARFCRRCGGPLRATAVVGDGTGDVSPQSPTVPLREEARTTDGLDVEGEGRASANTSRVGKAELERILRGQKDLDQSRQAPETGASSMPERDAPSVHPPSDSERKALHTTNAVHDTDATIIASPAITRSDVTATAFADDEDLTISVPRPSQPLETRESYAVFGQGEAAPPSMYATRVAEAFDPAEATATQIYEAAPNGGQLKDAQPLAPTHVIPSPTPFGRRRRWPLVVAAFVLVLLFAVGVVWVAVRVLRRPALTDVTTQPSSAPVTSDAVAQQFEQKLAEAESLLAQGNMDEAVARLREANALDPVNTRAHRRLGELLLASGVRREAVEEFRAVTRNAPEDFTAWRLLASAQFVEGLYGDAADSYKHLLDLVGEQSADANDLLSYADALRLSGRTDEARAVYEKVEASSFANVADIARQRLAELAKAQPMPAPTQRPGESVTTRAQDETASIIMPVAPPPVVQPSPTPQTTPMPAPPPAQLTPVEHYRRGLELWSSNRATAFQEFQAAANGGNVDANYYLGLSYVEGKSIQGLNRAALLAALRHFQIAQRGQFAGQSRNYAQQLEKEFDRQRK